MENSILLIGRAGEETNRIREELKDIPESRIDVASTPQVAIEKLMFEPVNLVVYNMDLCNRKKLESTKDLRVLGHDFPILVLAQSISNDLYEYSHELSHTTMLEKPYSTRELQGISGKLLKNQSVKQRVFRRFPTDQTVEITPIKGMQSAFSIQMKNLSHGGAYFETKEAIPLQAGDPIKVEIPLKDMSKTYRLFGRVIWIVPDTAWGEQPGLGVEFIR